jgi:hypothetical protein
MNEILTFSTDELQPERAKVLENQGLPAGQVVPTSIDTLCTDALDLLSQVAAPTGVMAEISRGDFEPVYGGEGLNERPSPVGDIYPSAERLALFAVTVGPDVGSEISARFASGDLALAAMLDSVASAAADKLAAVTQRRYAQWLAQTEGVPDQQYVLHYSPGYCGWHISGQRKLFDALRPERVGITLRESYLMEPLKSVSGVLIAGPREIHEFKMSYRYCKQCESRGCRERIRALRAG